MAGLSINRPELTELNQYVPFLQGGGWFLWALVNYFSERQALGHSFRWSRTWQFSANEQNWITLAAVSCPTTGWGSTIGLSYYFSSKKVFPLSISTHIENVKEKKVCRITHIGLHFNF